MVVSCVPARDTAVVGSGMRWVTAVVDPAQHLHAVRIIAVGSCLFQQAAVTRAVTTMRLAVQPPAVWPPHRAHPLVGWAVNLTHYPAATAAAWLAVADRLMDSLQPPSPPPASGCAPTPSSHRPSPEYA